MTSTVLTTDQAVQRLTTLLDNSGEGPTEDISDEVNNSVIAQGRSSFDQMIKTGHRREDFVLIVGEVVYDLLADVTSAVFVVISRTDQAFRNTVMKVIYNDVATARRLLGEHYLPTKASDVTSEWR